MKNISQVLPVIICLVLFNVATFVSAQQEVDSDQKTADDHAVQIKELLKTYADYGQFNGAILVAEKGQVIVREGYGWANMEWEIPNSATTKFRIGSVTKQFTAALILQLVDEGKVDLHEPITTYLPDYREDTGSKVTVHHLLCHTSGIPSYTTPEFFSKHSRDTYELGEFVERFASGDLEFEPGAEYAYSNSGYHLLGAIIEKTSGQKYAERLQQRILEPAGMTDSGFDVSATVLKNRAQGYSKTMNGYVNASYLDMGIPYSAGSMYSTVNDLFKWDRALYSNKILSDTSKKLMVAPNLRGYGYGVEIDEQKIGDTEESAKLIHHGGGINGFNCHFSRVVNQDHLVVVLDNVELGHHHSKITKSVINILNDQPYDVPKKHFVEELARIAMDQGGVAAVAKYRTLRENQAETYDFEDEEALNSLGYNLIAKDKIKAAIEIFKLNVEMFPESFNPYDSLGEAYLIDEQPELALANYRKSVEINPDNEGGVLAIKKIEGQKFEMDEAGLQTYVGTYELTPELTIEITLEDGVLMGQPRGQEKVALEAVEADSFFVPSVKASLKFLREGDKVTGMTLKQGDNELEGKRVEK